LAMPGSFCWLGRNDFGSPTANFAKQKARSRRVVERGRAQKFTSSTLQRKRAKSASPLTPTIHFEILLFDLASMEYVPQYPGLQVSSGVTWPKYAESFGVRKLHIMSVADGIAFLPNAPAQVRPLLVSFEALIKTAQRLK